MELDFIPHFQTEKTYKSMKIAVVGLGYVGLPLSLQFVRSGVTVLGLDVDRTKVELLNSGRSYIKHITSEDIVQAVKTGQFSWPRQCCSRRYQWQCNPLLPE